MLATATPPEISWRELPQADGLAEATESYPETRIEAFDFSEATGTEVIGYASGSPHRASIASCREVATDLGQYSQPDPIGLDGGLNLFAYANGQPMLFVDPLGLDVLTSDRNVRCCFYALWKDAGFGQTTQTERAAWVVNSAGSYSCVRWPWSAATRQETWKGPLPSGSVAFGHTHPKGTDPKPSAGDQATARKPTINMPVYTVTRFGIWKFDPSTSQTTQEEGPTWHDGLKKDCCEEK